MKWTYMEYCKPCWVIAEFLDDRGSGTQTRIINIREQDSLFSPGYAAPNNDLQLKY